MQTHLTIARGLVRLLENQFSIFNMRFGLDPIIGLIPGIGDIIAFIVSLYLLWIAKKSKLTQADQNKIVWNIALDLIIGSIPIAGDLYDFAFKANSRNLRIIEDHLSRIAQEKENTVEGNVIS